MIIEPLAESTLVPSRSYHTNWITYDFDMVAPVWSIIFVGVALSATVVLLRLVLQLMEWQRLATATIEDFKAAVNVTALWDNADWTGEPSTPACVSLLGNYTREGHLFDKTGNGYVTGFTVFCPNRLEYNNNYSGERYLVLLSLLSGLMSPLSPRTGPGDD